MFEVQGLLDSSDIHRFPTEIGNQSSDNAFRLGIAAAEQHGRLDVVGGIRRILEILEAVNAERLHDLRRGYQLLDHLGARLRVAEAVCEPRPTGFVQSTRILPANSDVSGVNAASFA